MCDVQPRNKHQQSWLDRHSSCCTNGLAISSLPSAGEMSTNNVPRATIRPSDRVVSLPFSSTVQLATSCGRMASNRRHTAHGLLDIIQDEVHQLIIPLENAADCNQFVR